MGEALVMSNLPAKKTIPTKHRTPGSVSMSDLQGGSLSQRYLDGLYSQGKLRTNKQLWEVLPKDIWKGRRVFIVGGGTSLRGFDFSKLDGEIVITVNRSFEHFPGSVFNVCQDARLWGWYEGKNLPGGEEAKKRFEQYKGYKVWLNVQAFPFPEDIYKVGVCHVNDFNWKSPTLTTGIPPYSNSGLNALNMAVCLGASTIYLLGFDMYGENGRTANFHAGYPESNKEDIYKNFITDFKDFAERIKGIGTKIINLNPKSAVRCFEFGSFEAIPKIKRPVVVSFYTKGTGYQIEKDRLDDSARRFGMQVDFYKQDNLGSWRANIHDRIRILRHFLDKYKDRDVLYIDCDAEVVQYPELFDNFDKGDIGIHKIDRARYFKNWDKMWKEEFEYLGGTMYFRNNERVRGLLNLWEKMDKPMNVHLSQLTLIYALRILEKKNELSIYEIPATYCQIFDIMADSGDPVIEHFQASRRGLIYHKVKEHEKH
jgi:hypothetical protein